MLQSDSYDDVVELCRSVALDPDKYQKFEFGVQAPAPKLETETADPAAEPQVAAAVSEIPKDAPSEPVIARTEPVFQDEVPLAQSEPIEPPTIPSPEPVVASSALLRGVEGVKRTLARESTTNTLSALAAVHGHTVEGPAILPLISGVGGSGATTVLASLGRALSILGERVLLVDARGPSTLDLFYQASSNKSNLLLSTQAASRFEGGVHVLRTHGDTPAGNQSYVTKFCRATAGLSNSIDRILIAGTDWYAPVLEQRTWSGGVCVLIVTPEMRSVMAVPSILKALAERSRKTGWQIEPWFLLNRFQEASPLHVNMRNRLSAQLGSRLLPFHIPESDLVQQALMQETTVLDLAPESDYSDACFTLAEWYRTNSNNVTRVSSPVEETQLVPERP